MRASSMAIVALTVVCLTGALPTSGMAFHSPNIVRVVGIAADGTQIQKRSFSLRTLRDLQITSWWNVPGSFVQRLELRAPDGSLYQRHTQKVKVGSITSHVGGDPRGTRARMVMPVGGTWITEYSLVGTWTVELYMGNARTPAASYSFTLTD